MRKISLSVLVLLLAGCTTSGTMNAPGSSPSLVSYSSVNNSRMLATGVDTEAINAAIAADNRQYWAPDDEVWQQSVDEEL